MFSVATSFYQRSANHVFIFVPFSILRNLLYLIDTDYVADTDRLQQSEIGEFIGRAAADAADTENDCDVIHSVRSALGHPFFVGAHKTVSLC